MGPPPFSLTVGVHGHPLHIQVLSRQARDVIADDRVGPGHGEPVSWSGPDGLAHRLAVEVPEPDERQLVNRKNLAPIAASGAAQDPIRPGRSGAALNGRGLSYLALKQEQLFVNFEPDGEKGLGLARRHRRRVGQGEPGIDSGRDRPPDRFGCYLLAVGVGHQVGDVGLLAPARDVEPIALVVDHSPSKHHAVFYRIGPLTGPFGPQPAIPTIRDRGGQYDRAVSLLFVTNDRCADHVAGRGHPERPARLGAVIDGLARADLAQAVTVAQAPLAPIEAITAVHAAGLVEHVQAVAESGGGRIDADTLASPASFEAARLAAGAGLHAIGALREGAADHAFCAVRPPGHHATPTQSMGFCLFNNVAVTARALTQAGERVLIVDYDAHHGNGTQDAFYADPEVMFVSFHQWPCYPGTGRVDETGTGAGAGLTVNIPLPPGATGDVYAQAWDRVVQPRLDAFAPTWLLLSAGFDAHRADPITDMGLSAGDYAALTAKIMPYVEPGRRIVFLEGGYDLDALTETTAAVLSTIVDHRFETEAETNGGPGAAVIDQAVAHWAGLG